MHPTPRAAHDFRCADAYPTAATTNIELGVSVYDMLKVVDLTKANCDSHSNHELRSSPFVIGICRSIGADVNLDNVDYSKLNCLLCKIAPSAYHSF